MGDLSSKIYGAFHAPAVFEENNLQMLKQEFEGLFPLTDDEKAGMDSFDESFEVRFVYNTTAMEGTTFTPGETALVLEGEFIPGKTGGEHFAVRGSADGLAYYKKAIDQDWDFSEDLIKNIHERTALDCQPATRGVYRRHAVYIRGSETVPSNWQEITLLMKDLVGAYRQSSLPELSKAALFHVFFENIHPFADGNGRCGRLVLNYMLEKAGYPPIAIKFDARAAYLQGLESWQVLGDPMPFLKIFSASVESELKRRIDCIHETRGDKAPSLSEVAKECKEVSQERKVIVVSELFKGLER